jgi:hypothetical protein
VKRQKVDVSSFYKLGNAKGASSIRRGNRGRFKNERLQLIRFDEIAWALYCSHTGQPCKDGEKANDKEHFQEETSRPKTFDTAS